MRFRCRRNTILAAVAASSITFIVMAATRPEPRTRFVAANQAVSIEDEAASATVVTRIYYVGDLLQELVGQNKDDWLGQSSAFDGPDSAVFSPSKIFSGPMTLGDAKDFLSNIIMDEVASDTWKSNGGSIGSMENWDRSLLVTQTERNQEAVEALLDQLALSSAFKPLPPGTHVPPGSRMARFATTQPGTKL
jgi:hypothetical protein